MIDQKVVNQAREAIRLRIQTEREAREYALIPVHKRVKLPKAPKLPRARNNLSAKEHRAFINMVKTAAVCTDCGKDWEPVALGFDHIPELGPKSFEISKGAGRTLGALVAEMVQCEIVCHSCHSIRTNNRIKANRVRRQKSR
jgi:hypothetical protein